MNKPGERLFSGGQGKDPDCLAVMARKTGFKQLLAVFGAFYFIVLEVHRLGTEEPVAYQQDLIGNSRRIFLQAGDGTVDFRR